MPIPENPSLQQTLDNPELLGSYQKYMEEQVFDPKPVPFLLAVQEYKKAAMDPATPILRLSEMASSIQAEYIKPDGYKQVGAGVGLDGADFLNIGGNEARQTNARVADLGRMASKGERFKAIFSGKTINREALASTFDAAERTTRTNLNARGNTLDEWKKTTEFGKAKEAARIGEVERPLNNIKRLEARAKQLQNSKWERFKASFSGGAEKEIASIVKQIGVAKLDVLRAQDPKRAEAFEREQQKMNEKLERGKKGVQSREAVAKETPEPEVNRGAQTNQREGQGAPNPTTPDAHRYAPKVKGLEGEAEYVRPDRQRYGASVREANASPSVTEPPVRLEKPAAGLSR